MRAKVDALSATFGGYARYTNEALAALQGRGMDPREGLWRKTDGGALPRPVWQSPPSSRARRNDPRHRPGGVVERPAPPAARYSNSRTRPGSSAAEDEARRLKHERIGTGHVLLGLIHQRESSAARVLESLDITLEGARAQVVWLLGVGQTSSSDQKGFTLRAKMVLELALREALSLGDDEVATHHILLAIWRENKGVGASILLRLGVDDEQIPEQITRVLSGRRGTSVRASGARHSARALRRRSAAAAYGAGRSSSAPERLRVRGSNRVARRLGPG